MFEESDPFRGEGREAVFSAATHTFPSPGRGKDGTFSQSDTIRHTDLEHDQRALKSAHNAATSVCRLPHETLSEIFLAMAASTHDADWVVITQVCRHWRNVAHECTALWVRLPILNAAFTESILPLTKNAPISLHLEDPAHEYKAIVGRIVAQINRLQSITLNLTSNECAIDEALFINTGAGELLKAVSIVCEGYRMRGFSFQDNLKKLDAPALERLSLEYCGVRWRDIPFPPQLTSLNLATDVPSHRPTLTQLVETLRKVPLLDSFSLSCFLPPCSQGLVEALPSTLASAFLFAGPTRLHLADSAGQYQPVSSSR
ncbi:hypothetical protein FA13DRAFT_563201 [Coprinellus micaceus]|uniref:F-box domain-containing protein n=1 Tax=Coprinellus micaceus TaxID=71717 RepID=A0A4Y7T7Q4_COPMI|nr:hypothetical protein FA13DRAFT_563201 [Coprinellus micaceus]